MRQKEIFNRIIKTLKRFFIILLADSLKKETKTNPEKKTWAKWWKDRFQERKQKRLNLKELQSDDWYYQHSWFEKEYFIHKLKRKTMDLIYKFYSSIEDHLLSNFLFEIEFYTPKSNQLDDYNKKNKTNFIGDFRCYLPLIIKAHNKLEAEEIAISIRQTLEFEYKATAISFKVSNKIILEETLDQFKVKTANIFENQHKGTIELVTITPQKVGQDNRIDKKEIRVVKTGPLPFRKNFDYVVIFTKTTNII